jgi:predicted aldo/keto reductase-like oxidoreductase
VHAIDRGVDFIDTSRLYTTSERRIGLALKQTDKRVVLASKSLNKTSDGIRADLETSLKELQVDHIDIYQCHFVRNEADYGLVTSPGGALEGLTKAKEEGLIGHIGLTSHSLDLLDRVLEDGLFETIMVCFSFLEPAASEGVIPKAIEKGIGVIAMKSFSGGVIENARLALKYVLSQEGVVIIPGVESKSLVDENRDVFQGDWVLDDSEQKEIEAIQGQYQKAFCRRCDYCQPCSEGIPIQTILGMRSIANRMGNSYFLDGPPRQAIEKARHCSECGECMTRCPYELPIPDLIKENLEWWDDQLKSF